MIEDRAIGFGAVGGGNLETARQVPPGQVKQFSRQSCRLRHWEIQEAPRAPCLSIAKSHRNGALKDAPVPVLPGILL